MAFNSEQLRKAYTANGVTTDFSFPWALDDATDLDVYLVDQAGTVLGTAGADFFQEFVTDYDIVGTYDASTGLYDDYSDGASVNFVVAPATGYTVVILRNTPTTQDTVPGTGYSASVIERALDKIAMMVQFLSDRSSRSIRLIDASPQTFDPTLPNPIVADCAICVSPDGTGLVMGPTVEDIADAEENADAAAISAAAALASQTAAANSASAAAASAALAATYVGAAAIGDTAFTIVNNQSSSANVTGLLFDGTSVRSAEIDIHVYRNTTGAGATELCARAKYIATYKTVAASWDLNSLGVGGDVNASTGQPGGVTLSITSAGQVKYTSTNETGTPASSVMHFRATTMAV